MDDRLDEWLWLWPLWLVLGGMLIYVWVFLIATGLELLCRMLEEEDRERARKRK